MERIARRVTQATWVEQTQAYDWLCSSVSCDDWTNVKRLHSVWTAVLARKMSFVDKSSRRARSSSRPTLWQPQQKMAEENNTSNANKATQSLLPSRSLFVLLFTSLSLAFALSLILLVFQPSLSSHRHLFRRPRNLPFNPTPSDVCHLITNPSTPSLWQFNSRSLCLSSRVCLRSEDPAAAYLHSAPLSLTTCHASRPDFLPHHPATTTPHDLSADCEQLQRQHVLCAHGTGLVIDDPQCPDISPLRNLAHPRARWFEHITFIVPDYPYTYNIYHYANLVSTLAHAVDALLPLLFRWGLANVHAPGSQAPYFPRGLPTITNINILFRAPEDNPPYQQWKNDLLQAVIRHRIQPQGINVSVHYLRPDPSVNLVCIRNAIVLGRRGHCNVWAFPNSTDVPLHGMSVPADAVDFRRALYAAFDINSRLPDRPVECRPGKDCGVSELPPFTLGYARREGKPDPESGYYKSGSTRRFSDADDEWFISMLQNETSAVGAGFEVFTTTGNETMREQVRAIVRVGFIVGIHGANLVNSMFMHPFGALLELLPAYLTTRCYIAGSNSGLAYYRHGSSEMASPEESGCDPEDGECKKEIRQRMVKLGSGEDRERARQFVRDGLRHLQFLHNTFPDGVPVTYNDETTYYDVRVPAS